MKNALVKFLNKPYVRRAIRTFFQTAVGYVTVNITTTDMTAKSAVKALVVSAVAAGLAAVMNLNEKEKN